MPRELLARRSAKWPLRPCQTQMASCPALSPFLFAPIFFGFPLDGRCIRVFHFEPIGRASRTVGRVLPLRHDSFEPHLAGMGEDGRAVALDMLVEPNTGTGLGQDRYERGLADLERVTAQVVAVELDQVEGVQEHVAVMLAVVDTLE